MFMVKAPSDQLNIELNQNKLIAIFENFKRQNLISDYTFNADDSGTNFVFCLHRKNDDKEIQLTTNLVDHYKLLFENYYEEFTAYLKKDEDFQSHIKWFLPFLESYLQHDYREIVYEKKSGELIGKRLEFTNKNLGRKELMSPLTVKDKLFKMLPGQYRKILKGKV